MPMNRRLFLKQAALWGILFSTNAAFSRSSLNTSSPQLDGRIDVHHHILPSVYISALAKIGIPKLGDVPFPEWSVQQSLDVMDRNGIATAITSIASSGVYFGDSKLPKDLARRCNEFSADLISTYKMRFGAFAVLPLPDVEAALNELEYALDALKLDGVALLSNVGGHYQGAPEFDDLYSELNRRKAVVHIHPTVPVDGKFPKLAMPESIIEFVFDTTRAISNLILNRTFERFPEIRFIVAHGGGTAPYIAWRMSLLDMFYLTNVIKDLKSLYYDTALSASPFALRSLQELVNPSHLLFGTDYPFAPELITDMTISGLDAFEGFDDKILGGINRENALTLFPRFA